MTALETVGQEEMPVELETEAPTQTPEYVIVCLGGLSVHVNGSPIFSCKVYGPFPEEDLVGVEREIRKLEGGAVLVRPLVDLNDTYRRISAD